MKRKILAGLKRWQALAISGLACLLGLLAWIATPTADPLVAPSVVLPERPPGGQPIPAGALLQPQVDAAPDGAVFYLSPGVYTGPLVIRKPLTLWGPRDAVIRTSGLGNTITVHARGVRLLGFTVDGSGDRPDLMDAGVLVQQGEDVRIEGLCVVNTLFGIAAERSRRIALVHNEIHGDPDTSLGLRGDGIRLWETRDSLIADNTVTHSRDILIWYAPDNQILNNTVRYGRYGTHFMYSSGAVVRGNRYIANTVGVFVMYSRNITLRDNLMAAASEAGGMGLGVKESGNVTVENNRFVHNHTGMYLDRSPFQQDDTVAVRGNLFALSQTAVLFHASLTRITITENSFRNNRDQVGVEGRGDALAVTWEGNAFDDYQGYDLDRDGYGDIPYEVRSLSNQIIARDPDLAFFRGSAALGLVEAISHIFPLFRPQPILIDSKPRMGQAEHHER